MAANQARPSLHEVPLGARASWHTCPAEPAVDYLLVRPPRLRDPRLIVAVHGVAEEPEALARNLASLALRAGATLVIPHFPRPAFQDYQRLGRRGPRADRALDCMVSAACAETGANPSRFFLFGQSGGGQFAHRYVMAWPSRIVAAAVGSPGWYTWPDRRRRYPLGLRANRRVSDLRFRADAFLRVPMLVTVGERDVQRDAELRTSPYLDRVQGRDRVERAQRWVAAMRGLAEARGLTPQTRLCVLPGARHDFESCVREGSLVERLAEHFFGIAEMGAA